MNSVQIISTDELETLVKRARKHDRSALARLCEAYYARMLKFMYYHAGKHKAEDLTNEVFLRVVRNIGKQKGRFEPWLYRIARNLVIDRARHKKASPEVEMDESRTEETGGGTDEQASVLARIDIREALLRLSPEHRELLTLKFIQGMNNREIGEITGQKPGAVRVMQFRALSAMKDALGQENT